MKRQYNFLSIILAIGLLTACSSDEPQGDRLPVGQYPLQVSATVGAPQSRSVGKDSWTGVGTEVFGVRIGADGRVAKYVITDTNGKAEPASGSSPLYWDNTDKATVSAWLPYEPQTDVDISDQSAGVAAYDFLAATAEGQSYLAPVDLNFTHKMAKVRCILKPGKGITEADLSSATVQFAGNTLATFSEGTLTGSGNGWIIPASDREALLVPQNMTGKDFITIEVDGNEFVYTPADDNAGLLKEGLLHQYTITVNGNGLEVSTAISGAWNDGGSDNVPLDRFIYDGTETEPKPGDYVYSDGTFSDGGLRLMLLDGWLEYVSVAPLSDKTCVGIVFHLRDSSSPKDECAYAGFDGLTPTGYIVSVDQNSSQWADKLINGNDQTPTDAINGYTYTEYYYSRHNAKADLIALKWCRNRTTITGSTRFRFSTWYMPSKIEYSLMRGPQVGSTTHLLNLLEANCQKASGAGFDDMFYFTSGLMGQYGNYLYLYNPQTGKDNPGSGTNSIVSSFPYRAVCAFKMM